MSQKSPLPLLASLPPLPFSARSRHSQSFSEISPSNHPPKWTSYYPQRQAPPPSAPKFRQTARRNCPPSPHNRPSHSIVSGTHSHSVSSPRPSGRSEGSQMGFGPDCRMVLGWVGLRNRRKRSRCLGICDVRRASRQSRLVEVERSEEVGGG